MLFASGCASDTFNKGVSNTTNVISTAVQQSGESLYLTGKTKIMNTSITLAKSVNATVSAYGQDPLISDKVKLTLVNQSVLAHAELDANKLTQLEWTNEKQNESQKILKSFEIRGSNQKLSPQSQASYDSLQAQKRAFEASTSKETKFKGQPLGESYHLNDFNSQEIDDWRGGNFLI